MISLKEIDHSKKNSKIIGLIDIDHINRFDKNYTISSIIMKEEYVSLNKALYCIKKNSIHNTKICLTKILVRPKNSPLVEPYLHAGSLAASQHCWSYRTPPPYICQPSVA